MSMLGIPPGVVQKVESLAGERPIAGSAKVGFSAGGEFVAIGQLEARVWERALRYSR